MPLISRDSTFTMLFFTVHVGPATLLVGGGLGAHDTYRHGGKGKICFISSYFSNYKPKRVAKKNNYRRLRAALLKLKPAKQCCGARAEEPKLNCLPEPEPKLRITAPDPDPYHFNQRLQEIV
jgi:hypothetical protein